MAQTVFKLNGDIEMNVRSLKPLLLAAVMGLFASAVMASGSDASGSADTGDARAYNIGKMVYFQKLACSGCALAGKTLDAKLARDLVGGTQKVTLSEEEAQALGVYLTRRFGL